MDNNYSDYKKSQYSIINKKMTLVVIVIYSI